jgi:hypothetical protein
MSGEDKSKEKAANEAHRPFCFLCEMRPQHPETGPLATAYKGLSEFVEEVKRRDNPALFCASIQKFYQERIQHLIVLGRPGARNLYWSQDQILLHMTRHVIDPVDITHESLRELSALIDLYSRHKVYGTNASTGELYIDDKATKMLAYLIQQRQKAAKDLSLLSRRAGGAT